MTIVEQQNNKRIAKNTLYMYFRMLIMLVVSLFTAGIVFNILGVTDYGVYNLVGCIVVFFSFFNNGLTQSTRRFITAEITSGSLESQVNLFNHARYAHFLVALIIFLLAESVGLWAINCFLNIPSNRLFSANVVYQVSVLTTLLNVMQVPFNAVIIANEKMNIYAYFSIIDVLLKLLLILAMVFIDYDKLIVYSVAMFASSFINISIYRVYCYKKFSMCKKQCPHNKQLFKEMFSFMGWSLLGQGIVIANNQGVSVLVNMFFSVAANAAMGVCNQITNVVNQFVSNFQVAFNPQITKLYVKNDYEKLIRLTLKCSRFSGYLIIIFMIPIFFQIDNILSLWLGNYPEYAVEFCILTLFGILVDSFAAPLWMILGSDKNIKKYQITVSSLYSLNFIGSWLFLFYGYPPYSVIMVRIIVFVVTLFVRLFLVKEKICCFPIKKWFVDVVLRSLIVIFIPAISMAFISKVEIINKIIDLLFKCGLAFLLSATSIFVLGLNNNEKKYMVNKFKQFMGLKSDSNL